MSQDDLLREIHGDIKVIKVKIEEIAKGKDELEKRLRPIEADYKFAKKLSRFIIRGVGIIGGIASLLFTGHHIF